MATVVITFFLLTRFCVCNMDAEFINSPRSGELSRREKRWSMNSQRLEEIVAELMKPISDVRRSFDTDLSALLEEYLTEAGLHALEASEQGRETDSVPNYTELALLLQHSASVYGRKVDFLYQHVINVSEELHNNTQESIREEVEPEEAEGVDRTPSGSRRRRRGSNVEGFGVVELEPSAGAARDVGRARPPPTLPRAYIELEPRAMTAADHPLTDYDNEPIGLLADFHVAWRLQGGMLVDELEDFSGGESRPLRPLPLMELQAALQAAAPPAPPPLQPEPDPAPDERDDSPPRDLSALPLHCSTPLSMLSMTPPLPPLKRERKRKNSANIDHLVAGSFKIVISKEAARRLSRHSEFSVSAAWVAGVVAMRRSYILRQRRALKLQPSALDFLGFEDTSVLDMGGFLGWSNSEAEASRSLVCATRLSVTGNAEDSDDDGFFEQSSLGESEGSRVEDATLPTPPVLTPACLPPLDAQNPWLTWQADVVARAAQREARPPDVRELAGRLLAAVPRGDDGEGAEPPAVPCNQLFATAGEPSELPALFLASLFLANSGNLDIVQGPPLSLNSFSVRYVTDDASRYCAAAAEEPSFLR